MKIAIYSRKSKFTGKGESIENQIQLCKDYAANLPKNDSIEFFEYEDEGFSGGNTNRPKFQNMMEDARARKFNTLICYRLDRISRNVSDFSTTLDELQRYNIDFISIREQFDTSTPMGRAMIYIASVFAQLERETIAERVRDNMLELSKTGRWLGGVAPIGYDSEPISYVDADMNERSMVKLKQVPRELEVVADLYKAYLKLGSLAKIETYALQNHIKTKRGANFTKANIRLVLTNPVYVKATSDVINHLEEQGVLCCGDPDGVHGLLTYNKSKAHTTESGKIARVFRDKSEWIAAVSSHKGIIEAEEWIKVQLQLAANRDKYPNEGKTNNSLLTGRLRCDCCGSNMTVNHGHISAKTGNKMYYYACAMKKFSKGSRCDNKNAKVIELDAFILTFLKSLPSRKEDILKTIAAQNKKEQQLQLSDSKEAAVKKSISEKNKQIDSLLNKLSLDDELTDLLINKIKSLKVEVEELNKELAEIEVKKSECISLDINLDFINSLIDRCSIIDSLTHDEQKQLIDGLIERIDWNGSTEKAKIHLWGSTLIEEPAIKKKLNFLAKNVLKSSQFSIVRTTFNQCFKM